MKDTELFALMNELDDDTIDCVQDNLNKSKSRRIKKAVMATAFSLVILGSGVFVWSVTSGTFRGKDVDNVGTRENTVSATETPDNRQFETDNKINTEKETDPIESNHNDDPYVRPTEENLFLKRFTDTEELGGGGISWPIGSSSFSTIVHTIPDEMIINDKTEIPDVLPIYRLCYGVGFGGYFKPMSEEEKQTTRDRLRDAVEGIYGFDAAEGVEVLDEEYSGEGTPFRCFCKLTDESGSIVTLKSDRNGISIFFDDLFDETDSDGNGSELSNVLDKENIVQSAKDNPTVQKVIEYVGFESPVYISSAELCYTAHPEKEHVGEIICYIYDSAYGRFLNSGVDCPIIKVNKVKGFNEQIVIYSPEAEIIDYAKTGTPDEAMETLKAWLQDSEGLCDLDNAKTVLTYRTEFWEKGDFSGNDPRDGEEFLVPVYDIYVEGTGDNAGRWIIFKIRATDFDARTRKPEN